jgi:two-component system chemotaxis response regulator CheY
MPLHVLVVDDSPTVRGLIRLYLRGLDLEFEERPGAHEALDTLAKSSFDMVITDINMPGMDGITFVRRLRDSPIAALRGLPVILLTGDKKGETRTSGLEAGASAVVTKPVARAELRETLCRFLSLVDKSDSAGPT